MEPKLEPPKLVAVKPHEQYKEQVLKVLRDIEERLEKGEVIGIAASLVMTEGSSGAVYTQAAVDYVVRAIGGVEILKQKLLAVVDSD